MWAVIETYDGNMREVATVPQIRLKNTDPKGIFWQKSKNISTLIKHLCPPGDDWQLYNSIILYSNTCKLNEARQIEKKCILHSNSE
jgi:hypothetical protein